MWGVRDIGSSSKKGKIECWICESDGSHKIIVPNDYKEHILSGGRCSYEEYDEELYPITNKKTQNYSIAKHEDLMIDKNDIIYKQDGDVWIEIGYIKDEIIIIN